MDVAMRPPHITVSALLPRDKLSIALSALLGPRERGAKNGCAIRTLNQVQGKDGRGAGTRTPGLVVPNDARYQLRYTP